MKKVYPVIFTHNENMVLVEVPDLEILTQGESITDAIDMARDAIGLTLVAKEASEDRISEPSKTENVDITKSEFYEKGNSILSLVDIDVDEYKRKNDNRMVRRNVTLPNWLNLEAEKEHINVSKVLQEALKERLEMVER